MHQDQAFLARAPGGDWPTGQSRGTIYGHGNLTTNYVAVAVAAWAAFSQIHQQSIQHIYGAMDPFQVCRPVHSPLSSLSIPMDRGNAP